MSSHYDIHGFWFKKFPFIKDRLVLELRCLKEVNIPEWMTKGKIILIQKDHRNRTTPQNYRPIRYQPIMWKILTALIREEIYYLLIIHGLFPGEHKGCHKGTKETDDQYIV